MSIKTWKEEFYPVDASTFRELPLTPENLDAAARHSLQKWIGARIGNVKFSPSCCGICRFAHTRRLGRLWRLDGGGRG